MSNDDRMRRGGRDESQAKPGKGIGQPAGVPGKRTLTMSLPPRPASTRTAASQAPVEQEPDPAATRQHTEQTALTAQWMDVAMRPDLHPAPVQRKSGPSPAANAPAASPAATAGSAGPAGSIDPPRGGINKPGFIDSDDGSNIRTGPAELEGATLTAQPLAPATRVFVSGQHPEAPQWWYVSAFLPGTIVRGYVQHFRINTDLPEPGARLYQIKSGDTVERLAVREFSAAVRDGHDLRYYENVLLAVNRDKKRAGIKGTFQNPNVFGGGANNIQLEAGRRIWLVSPAYARTLEGMVSDGSLTNGVYAKAKRVLGHIEDLVQSVTDSPRHFGTVAGEYAQIIKAHLPEIIGITAGFILAESLSAFLAATPTGVGQLAAVIIQLGLAAFGATVAVDAGALALKQGETWLTLAWTAHGDARQLAQASKAFLQMLVSMAMAALAMAGVRGNAGKGFKVAGAIKIQPPTIGMSPAMAGAGGGVVAGHPVFMPGSISSAGPVDIGVSAMSGMGAGGSKATTKESGSQESAATQGKPRAVWNVERFDKVVTWGKGKNARTIKRDPDTGLWWSRDTARHGGSEWKVFRETKSGLEHYRDADKYGDFIMGKHKGDVGKFIPWRELN